MANRGSVWIPTVLVLLSGPNSPLARGAESPGWVEVDSGLPRAGQWRNGFDLGDLNGDGRLDLVHGAPRRGQGGPALFLGGSGFEFSRWDDASFPDLPLDYGDAAVADFDGDGHADVALGVHLRGLGVFAGNGRGGFRELSSFSDSASKWAGFSSRALAVGDLNGDDRPDIVALGEGPHPGRVLSAGSYGLRALINRLPAPWVWRELYPASGRLFGDDVALGDFDNDGNLDIAVASAVQNQRGVVFWGDGLGGFLSGELGAGGGRSFIGAVAVADFDGDRDDDLVIAYSDLDGVRERCGIDLLVASGDRTWQRFELVLPEATGRPTALSAGDPDGDEDMDLVYLTDSGALGVFFNQSGRLAPGPGLGALQAGRGCRARHARLADLDGDGRDEVVAGFADETCPGGGSLRAWKLSGGTDAPPPP